MAEYFSYIEENSYEGDIKGDFKYHPRLHLRFFSHQDPNMGIPSPKSEKFEECFTLLNEARFNIGKILELGFIADSYPNYLQACKSVSLLADIMVIAPIYKISATWEREDNKQETIIGNSPYLLVGAYRYARSYMRILCEFSGYDTSWFDSTKPNTFERKADKSKINIPVGRLGVYIQSLHNRLECEGFKKL